MLTGGQVTAGTSPVLLCRVPPGPVSVALTSAGTVTAYLGLGTTAAASTGIPLPSGGVVPFTGFAGDLGSQLAVVTAGGSATVGWVVSAASGGTGP
jgi:hypothetical protein